METEKLFPAKKHALSEEFGKKGADDDLLRINLFGATE